MNKIYIIISELSDTFRKMCYGITKDKEAINDAVQELMIYYLQMNPETLKKIYDKDGEKGLIGYSAVVIKRSLTSIRSPFYYKYKKYYTNLTGVNMTPTSKNNFQLGYRSHIRPFKSALLLACVCAQKSKGGGGQAFPL